MVRIREIIPIHGRTLQVSEIFFNLPRLIYQHQPDPSWVFKDGWEVPSNIDISMGKSTPVEEPSSHPATLPVPCGAQVKSTRKAGMTTQDGVLGDPRFKHVWVNYNELTTSSLEIIVSKGNHLQMALIQVSELL